MNTTAQPNSFWHLQTGIRSCPCDRSRLGFRHGGSYKEACYYYFCRRRVLGLPIPDPSVQRLRVVCTLSLNFLVLCTSVSNHSQSKNTEYQIIRQYQREEDQLSELFSSPRRCRTGQYIWLLTLYPNQTVSVPLTVIHTAEDETVGHKHWSHVWGMCGLARFHSPPSRHGLLSREGDHELITAFHPHTNIHAHTHPRWVTAVEWTAPRLH